MHVKENIVSLFLLFYVYAKETTAKILKANQPYHSFEVIVYVRFISVPLHSLTQKCA